MESHPTQEVKSSKGTGVGLSKETGLRVKEQGPKEKVSQSFMNKVRPKGKKEQ